MNISNIIDIVKSQLIQHLSLVFIGNIFGAGMGFLAVLIVSRELTVNDFGLFNMAISVILITSRLSSLGMDTTMIKFTSSYLVMKKKAEANYVFRTIFLARIIISSLIAAVLFSTADALSTKIFHQSNLTSLLKLAAFGGLIISILNNFKSVLHAYQLFRKSVILQLFVDFSKLCVVVLLTFYLKMSAFTAVAIFAFMPLLGITLGFQKTHYELFSEKKPIKNLFRQLFSYSKWMFISNICNLTLPYVGIFMISRTLGYEATGIYGLALNLAYIFPIVIYSLYSVLLPKVSRFREITEFKRYIKGSLKVSFGLGIFIIPFLFFSHSLIHFFFGPRYLGSVPVFNWFLLGYTVLIIITTIQVALHSINKPYIIAMVDIVSLLAMIFGCYILIPLLGVIAPAIIMFIINMSNLGFLSIYTFKQISSGVVTFQNVD
ncbi:MAG: hypothetical protein E3K32_10425 [wastewater metagenome]|nr:hypothetical protein [Candidatus Loosdrechtia aerotolerans]